MSHASRLFNGQIIRNEVRLGSSAGGVQILPFTAEVVDVLMSSVGEWSVECAVADHVLAGLKGRLRVVEGK
jgi:hypothetical protein